MTEDLSQNALVFRVPFVETSNVFPMKRLPSKRPSSESWYSLTAHPLPTNRLWRVPP